MEHLKSESGKRHGRSGDSLHAWVDREGKREAGTIRVIFPLQSVNHDETGQSD
jgi:hypothetical protein